MEISPNEGWPVSRGELKVRFGCGGLAGFVLGGFIAFRWTGGNLTVAATVAVVAAIVIAVAAAKYGDRFWSKMAEILWWWWPTQ